MNHKKSLELPDLKNCLEIPLPYLLQLYSKEELMKLTDNEGFGLMHWAVGESNFSKIYEMIDSGFELNIKSNTNTLNLDLQILSQLDEGNLKINFSDGGLTPLHLNIYLYKQYEKKYSQSGKGAFQMEILMKKQLEFFKELSSENYFFTDNSNLSITDYCFLLENITYLNIIISNDPSLESLKQVTPKTALLIIKNYNKYKQNIKPFNLDNLLSLLEKKSQYTDLTSKLNKDIVKSTLLNKI